MKPEAAADRKAIAIGGEDLLRVGVLLLLLGVLVAVAVSPVPAAAAAAARHTVGAPGRGCFACWVCVEVVLGCGCSPRAEMLAWPGNSRLIRFVRVGCVCVWCGGRGERKFERGAVGEERWCGAR